MQRNQNSDGDHELHAMVRDVAVCELPCEREHSGQPGDAMDGSLAKAASPERPVCSDHDHSPLHDCPVGASHELWLRAPAGLEHLLTVAAAKSSCPLFPGRLVLPANFCRTLGLLYATPRRC